MKVVFKNDMYSDTFISSHSATKSLETWVRSISELLALATHPGTSHIILFVLCMLKIASSKLSEDIAMRSKIIILAVSLSNPFKKKTFVLLPGCYSSPKFALYKKNLMFSPSLLYMFSHSLENSVRKDIAF